MAFAITLQMILQTPMGWTPGFLFSDLKRQAKKGAISFGSTHPDAKCLANEARASNKILEEPLKLLQRRFNIAASIPDGPAVPNNEVVSSE